MTGIVMTGLSRFPQTWLQKNKIHFSLAPLALACSISLFSQHTSAMEVDGQLNEVQWQTAHTLVLDKTIRPFSLAAAPVASEVKYFTSEEGIHVAVIAQQPKTQQTAMRTARDSNLESDYIELIIDFDNSKNTAYGFILGNGGSMRDGIWQNNNSFKSDWDGTWFGKTTQTDNSWTAEYLIPWSVAPMAQASSAQRQLGLFVRRHDVKSDSSYSQVPTSREQPDFIREFGTVSVDNFASSSLEIFGSAMYQRDMLNSKNSSNLSLDIFWRPDASQQLSVALNPDFGQVESDNLVVNFSPFETFFAERRSFFTENQSLFDLQGNAGLRLVHTRRIGVDGDIDAAVKYTRNGQNIDFGAMMVIEDDTHSGLDASRFATARGQYKFTKAQVGYLATYADRASEGREAQVHTIDFRTDVSDSIQIQGQFSGSFIDNKHTQEPDTQGQGAWFNVVHKFNDNWQQRLNLTRYTDDYDVNDLGFLSRNDLQRIYYSNERYFTDFSADDSLKQRRVELAARVDYNSQGDHLKSFIFLSGNEEYKDTSFLFWRAEYITSGKDDRTSRGNGIFNTESGYEFFTEYNFGNQNKFRHHIGLGYEDTFSDGQATSLHYHPSYYFTDNYRISWSLWAEQEKDSLLWIDNQLARYNFKELNNSIDFDATIDDKQELRVRFQWISATGTDGQAQRINSNGDLYASNAVANDFSRSTTRLQIRYRYELSPLSNIFLVYSRGGRSVNDLNQANLELFSEGWGERTGDNFVAKIRYRF
ncbi:hypothetical protein HJP15_06405 [Pseudoalteromonas sp. NEC-BIFX-2020_002]|uniref:DUF5916 domain-containing protein n=1 Tax=Pseudoalteromonas sp. NEC-BIFX-2020_002 TaxID=2732353 RepID=UPI001476A1D4|nr:DUF5916 domain-containing protein [Pseudoalteromonas sp. NEC-BIFX-2020_002]NNG42557.1 hypothetical protein [Pseudoalteromonas sp. NEC-BIFX-2020_002]